MSEKRATARPHDPEGTTDRKKLRAGFYALMLKREGYAPDEVAYFVKQKYPKLKIAAPAARPEPPREQAITIAPVAGD